MRTTHDVEVVRDADGRTNAARLSPFLSVRASPTRYWTLTLHK